MLFYSVHGNSNTKKLKQSRKEIERNSGLTLIGTSKETVKGDNKTLGQDEILETSIVYEAWNDIFTTEEYVD